MTRKLLISPVSDTRPLQISRLFRLFRVLHPVRNKLPGFATARDLQPDDLKQNNIILMGTSETNPWVQLFEKDMNFVFLKDRAANTSSVINRKPASNEPREWVYKDTDPHRVYGLVAHEPNIVDDKNVLILEGTGIAGTQCARDFISNDEQLLPFLQKIRRKDGTIRHFEILLETNNINGSPVKASILTWRTTP